MSLAKRVKRWFTGTPDEYTSPTNDYIRKHQKGQTIENSYQWYRSVSGTGQCRRHNDLVTTFSGTEIFTPCLVLVRERAHPT